MQVIRSRTGFQILFVIIMLLIIVTGASAGYVSCHDVDVMSRGPCGYTVATGEVVCEPSACIAVEGCEEVRGACEHAADCDGKTCIKIIKVEQESRCSIRSQECCPAAKECCIKL
jgi:hypothetical protein